MLFLSDIYKIFSTPDTPTTLNKQLGIDNKRYVLNYVGIDMYIVLLEWYRKTKGDSINNSVRKSLTHFKCVHTIKPLYNPQIDIELLPKYKQELLLLNGFTPSTIIKLARILADQRKPTTEHIATAIQNVVDEARAWQAQMKEYDRLVYGYKTMRVDVWKFWKSLENR